MSIFMPESFYSTTLASAITAGQNTIPVTVAPTLTSGFLVLEANTSNREIILYTGVSGTTLTGVTRGLASYGTDISAGTGKAHPAGVEIANKDVHYYTAQYYDFLNGTSATGANTMKIGDGGTCSAANRIWQVPLSSYTPFWGLSANGRAVVSEDGINSYVISAGGSGLAAGRGIEIVAGNINLSASQVSAVNWQALPTGSGLTPTSGSQFATKSYVDDRNYTNVAIGTTTKDASDASTTQNIAHGLGRTPKFVYIKLSMSENAFGSYPNYISEAWYNGTTQISLSFYVNHAAPVLDTNFRINKDATAADYWTTGVVTFDATNISIAWTKTGSPTGIYTIIWEAY